MYENPWGVPVEIIDEMVATLPHENTAQTVFGKFVESSGLVFTAELINELFDRSMPKVNGDFWYDQAATRQLRREQRDKPDPYRCAIGVDLARKKDHTVIFVIDTYPKPARVLYFKRMNRVPWEQIYAEIARSQWLYGGELLLDGTGTGGDVVMGELQSRLYCPYHHETFPVRGVCPERGKQIPGFELEGGWCEPKHVAIDPQEYIFSANSKVQLINHLQEVLGRGYSLDRPEDSFGVLRCPPIQVLQDELTEYAWDDKKLQTDCIFALALAAYQGIAGIVEDAFVGSIYGE